MTETRGKFDADFQEGGRPRRDQAEMHTLMVESYSLCVEFKLLAAEPVQVWVAAVDAKTYRHHPPITERALYESFDVLSRPIDFAAWGWTGCQPSSPPG